MFIDTWYANSNEPGKIFSLVRRFGARIDMTALFQFGERHIGHNAAALVEQFVPEAIHQNTPVPRRAVRSGSLGANRGGAIVAYGVIPLRLLAQMVRSV